MKTLIKNGFVVDPINRINSKLNLLIENGKISGITTENAVADNVIDAEGLIVCPGFIDIHMHEDPYDENEKVLDKSIATTMLRMGVTSAIGGNCGINTNNPKMYLDIIDKEGTCINMGMFCGHTYFRNAAGMTDKYAKIDDERLNKMVDMMTDCINSGCFGVSFGVKYVPGVTMEELKAAASVCVPQKKMVTAHVRNDGDGVFDAIKELIELGDEFGLPVENSHIGSMGGFGQMERLLAMIDSYNAEKYFCTSDCYPYYAFSTKIGESTYDDFLGRYEGGYSVIEVCEGKYKGMRCTEEIFFDLRENYPETITVAHVMNEEDVDRALLHPNVLLASDGLMNKNQGHPRAAGTFPRFIKNYVKTGKISLYDAIEKMTSKQSIKLGLKNKGNFTIGSDADITIFNLDEITDCATFANPVLPPKGIEYVIIGGEIALKSGEVIKDNLGRAIRK